MYLRPRSGVIVLGERISPKIDALLELLYGMDYTE